MILGISGILYSLDSLLKVLGEYQESNQKYKEIQEIYTGGYGGSDTTIIEKLTEINEDYIGWIRIDATKINYPVVHTSDNEFYLSHNFYKERDKAGTIFLDAANSRTKLDKNMILYGHNMKDNSMFGELKRFKDEDFFNHHSTIMLEFHGHFYEWEIFSVYTAKDREWMQIEFPSAKEFKEYVNLIKECSLFISSTEVMSNDYVLTLSTCTNTNKEERIIVHAKLIR